MSTATIPAAGTRLAVVGDTVTVLTPATVTGSAFESFLVEGPEGSGPPPHSHQWHETFYLLEGQMEVMLDGEVSVRGSGDHITIPAGTLHCFRVLSDQARMLVVTSGERASRFFADLDASVPAGTPTDETMPAIIEVAKRNGLSSPLF